VEYSLKHFEVLYLEVSIDELFKRLNTSAERAKRPLLSEGDLRSKLEALLAERERFYSFGSILRIKLSD
jgi:shikimate kinase